MENLLEYLAKSTKIMNIPKLPPMMAPNAIEKIFKDFDHNIKRVNYFYEWDTNFYNYVNYDNKTGLILEVDSDSRHLWCIHMTNRAKEFEEWALSNRNGRQEFLFDYAVLYQGTMMSLQQVSYFTHFAKTCLENGYNKERASQLLGAYSDFADFKVIDDDTDYLYISI